MLTLSKHINTRRCGYTPLFVTWVWSNMFIPLRSSEFVTMMASKWNWGFWWVLYIVQGNMTVFFLLNRFSFYTILVSLASTCITHPHTTIEWFFLHRGNCMQSNCAIASLVITRLIVVSRNHTLDGVATNLIAPDALEYHSILRVEEQR